MKKILIIAFHYPPFTGSSGVQRALSLSKYLPGSGWKPIILTVNERAYKTFDYKEMENVPEDVVIDRCLCFDVTRHLAFKGKYLSLLALPDNWSTWYIHGVIKGLRLIKEYEPSVIWSTYPIATAHYIGASLNYLSKIPWIADYRDPMVEYIKARNIVAPSDKKLRKCRLFIERYAAKHAAKNIFTTNGALTIFKDRYHSKIENLAVVRNGYDENSFLDAELTKPEKKDSNKIKIIHSGSLYPTPDRNPEHLFIAIKELIEERKLKRDIFEIHLRATGADEFYIDLINKHKLHGIVQLKERISYKNALREMIDADGLVVFQGMTSNPAIPAKIYEYIRAQKPILALTDKGGDTARLLMKLNIGVIAPLDSKDEIKKALLIYLEGIMSENYPKLADSVIQTFSREHSVMNYVKIFNEVVQGT